jgi:hypothetical protein
MLPYILRRRLGLGQLEHASEKILTEGNKDNGAGILLKLRCLYGSIKPMVLLRVVFLSPGSKRSCPIRFPHPIF